MPAPLRLVLLVNLCFPVIAYEVGILLLVDAHVLLRRRHLTRLAHHLHVLHVRHVDLAWSGLHHIDVHGDTSRHVHAVVHLILIVHSLRLFESIIRYYLRRLKRDEF